MVDPEAETLDTRESLVRWEVVPVWRGEAKSVLNRR